MNIIELNPATNSRQQNIFRSSLSRLLYVTINNQSSFVTDFIEKDNNDRDQAVGDGDDDEGVDVNSPGSQGSGCQKFQLCGLKTTKARMGERGPVQ